MKYNYFTSITDPSTENGKWHHTTEEERTFAYIWVSYGNARTKRCGVSKSPVFTTKNNCICHFTNIVRKNANTAKAAMGV